MCFVKGDNGFRPCPKPWDEEILPESASGLKLAERKELAKQLLNKLLQPFYDDIMREFRKLYHKKLDPILPENFANTFYTGAKRKVYEHAFERSKLGTPELHKIARVKIFIKDEYVKPGGVPRVISPRDPMFNLFLGCFLRPHEGKIFGLIDAIFEELPNAIDGHTVAKHLDQIDRSKSIHDKWSRFVNPVAVALDASRFDQHINVLCLQLEHQLYLMLIEHECDGVPFNLPTLLREQLCNTMVMYRGHDYFKARVDGVRMSGDMNTSLGNVTVMCMIWYSFHKHHDIPFELLNDGDDCVVIFESDQLEEFIKVVPPYFLKFGIEMKIDGVHYEVDNIDFCQAKPIQVSKPEDKNPIKYIMAPNPAKRVFSDLVSTKNLAVVGVYKKWVGAVAGCGLALSPGVPIMQSFYLWLARIAQHYEARVWIPKEGNWYYKYGYRKVTKYREPQPITDLARASYERAWGYTPDQQKKIENIFDNMGIPSIFCQDSDIYKMAVSNTDLNILLGSYYKRYDDHQLNTGPSDYGVAMKSRMQQ